MSAAFLARTKASTMTVQTSTNVAGFNGDGANKVFPVGYKFNSAAGLVVTLIDDEKNPHSVAKQRLLGYRRRRRKRRHRLANAANCCAYIRSTPKDHAHC